MHKPADIQRLWAKVDRRGPDECWPWLAAVRKKDEGYGAFYLNGRNQPASRIAYVFTYGQISPDLVVCHRCDNPTCCNPSHLFVGRPQDNDADRVAKSRQARGAQNGFAKLTDRSVWTIRKLRKIGAKPRWLAEWFQVTPAHVWSICTNRRETWRHVDDWAMAKQAREEWDCVRR